MNKRVIDSLKKDIVSHKKNRNKKSRLLVFNFISHYFNRQVILITPFQTSLSVNTGLPKLL
jgi:hypothetical protein